MAQEMTLSHSYLEDSCDRTPATLGRGQRIVLAVTRILITRWRGLTHVVASWRRIELRRKPQTLCGGSPMQIKTDPNDDQGCGGDIRNL